MAVDGGPLTQSALESLRDRLRHRELSTDIDALSTEFYKQLREAIADGPAIEAAHLLDRSGTGQRRTRDTKRLCVPLRR